LEVLEGRTLPAAATTGSLTAFAFLDANGNGRFDPGESGMSSLPATLTGKTTTGVTVSQIATSNAAGSVTFFELNPGTYTVSFLAPGYSGSGVISGIKVVAGKTTSVSTGFEGLSAAALTERLFLNTSTPGDFRLMGPSVTSPIGTVTVTTGLSQTVDLSGNFTAPDITTSLVRMDTSGGPVLVELYDSLTPMTVANFYNYINSGRYDESIFHRRATAAADNGLQVLQGGGFTFQSTTSGGTTTTTLPAIHPDTDLQGASEVGLGNVTGTISMANQTGPNTASSQFFFNLINNSTALGPSNNGGFTVFGKLLAANDQTVINTLSALTTPTPAPASPFNEIPLASGANVTTFPNNLKKSDLALISDAVVVNRPEFLTYSVVSNSAPGVVIASVSNERLTLNGLSSGSATITVQATDQYGSSTTTSFTVNVV